MPKTFVQFCESIKEETHEMPYYKDWGWVTPIGKILDGTTKPGVKNHIQFMKKLGYAKYAQAYKAGMIRWLVESDPRDGSFHLMLGISKHAKDVHGKIVKIIKHVPMPISAVSIDWFDLKVSDETSEDTFDAPVKQLRALIDKLPTDTKVAS